MIKAVIVDDEPSAISNLLKIIASSQLNITIECTFNKYEDAVRYLTSSNIDLLFLDIQLGNKTGFELLREMDKHTFEVIFVTAYDKYALQAIKISALDYLLKPIDLSDFKRAIEKAEISIKEKSGKSKIDNLIAILETFEDRQSHKIALQSMKEIRFVEIRSIIYCESNNNYTSFRLNDETVIITSRPIYEYESLLTKYGFVRCHQSFLINRTYIKAWNKEDNTLQLSPNVKVPVSKTKKDAVKFALGVKN